MEHRMERKRIQFGLNTESFVDLNTGKFKSVKQWRKKMRSFGQISCVMLNSPVNNKGC